MIAADKDNLVTTLAQELLQVREKEMRFYMRNLKMVGTHAALLAGFAFTILSQYDFKVPDQGFLRYEWEYELGMWPENSTYISEAEKRALVGFPEWPWHVWVQQLSQLAHLLFTTAGMVLQLWTVYTCVVTNILGLHLALRGPEGSVDRAVRHMAQQNQFALKKFIFGLVLFIGSVLFFSLSEYHPFVSIFVCIIILTLSSKMYQHIRGLVATFYIKQDDTITGQWNLREGEGESSEASFRRASSRNRRSADIARVSKVRLSCMGDMLASSGRRMAFRSTSRSRGLSRGARVGDLSPPRAPGPGPVPGMNKSSKFAAAMEVVKHRPKAGTRWAPLHTCGKMMDDPSTSTRRGTEIEEQNQNPSLVAQQLIFKQQKAVPVVTPLSRQNSGLSRASRCASGAWRSSSRMMASIRNSARYDSPASSRWSTRSRTPNSASASPLPKGAVLTDSARQSYASARDSVVDASPESPTRPRGGAGGSSATPRMRDDSPDESFSFRPGEERHTSGEAPNGGAVNTVLSRMGSNSAAAGDEAQQLGLDRVLGQVMEKLGMTPEEPDASTALEGQDMSVRPTPPPRAPSVEAQLAAARWMGVNTPAARSASSLGGSRGSDAGGSRASRVSFDLAESQLPAAAPSSTTK